METTTMTVPDKLEVGTPLPTLNIEQIMSYIPHRYPFLLLDAVTEHHYRKSIKGYKNVSANEPVFQGHFPGQPIYPGVMQVESLAQLGCVLLKHLTENQGKLAVFAGIENVRFRRLVQPGDRFDMEMELVKYRPGLFGKAVGRGLVNGEVAIEGEVLFSFVDREEGQ